MDLQTQSRIKHPYHQALLDHYVRAWSTDPQVLQFSKGPIQELPHEFCVLRFAPTVRGGMWRYATLGMSMVSDASPLELHMLAREPNDQIVELLVATAHYHRTQEWLGLGHSVNFGKPWGKGSSCDHGLISLPYLDGPTLEWLRVGTTSVRFLWLIPVTGAEVEFKRMHGLEALEHKFEITKFDYLNPWRESVV